MTAAPIAAARARQLARILRPFDAIANLPPLELDERDAPEPAVQQMISRARERMARAEVSEVACPIA